MEFFEGQKVWIISIHGGFKKATEAYITEVVEPDDDDDEEGYVMVTVFNGVKCPWRKRFEEIFLSQEEAEEAVKQYYKGLPSIHDVLNCDPLSKPLKDGDPKFVIRSEAEALEDAHIRPPTSYEAEALEELEKIHSNIYNVQKRVEQQEKDLKDFRKMLDDLDDGSKPPN